MSKSSEDYERVVKQLIEDPQSYDNWASHQNDEEEIKHLLNESIWGDDE
jgi:hypothetical protein